MKLLTCYTQSHSVFLKHFATLYDLNDDIEIILKLLPQECPTGEFADAGWKLTTARKFVFILEELDKCKEGELLIFSDVDVQFFRPITPLAEKALANHDIVFQNDYIGHACTGFFYMRNNESVRNLIAKALALIPTSRDDQDAMNKILPTWEGKYALLPVEFFTFGIFHQHWHEKYIDFPIPDGIVMHHANWIKGIEKKLKLLITVRSIYENRIQLDTNTSANQTSEQTMGTSSS